MPFGWSAMLMTVFVVGLNAPSLPLLPLFTCACAARHRSSSKRVGTVREKIRARFIGSLCFGCKRLLSERWRLKPNRPVSARLIFVIWLALTPALSPEERVSEAASLENSVVTVPSPPLRLSPGKPPDNSAHPHRQSAANNSPSPGGEGWGEGGRFTNFMVVVLAFVWAVLRAESRRFLFRGAPERRPASLRL